MKNLVEGLNTRFEQAECCSAIKRNEVLCYGLNVMSPLAPSNSHVEPLIRNIMVFGGGAFRRQLGLDEAVMAEPP